MSDDWTPYHEYRKATDPPPYGQGLDDLCRTDYERLYYGHKLGRWERLCYWLSRHLGGTTVFGRSELDSAPGSY